MKKNTYIAILISALVPAVSFAALDGITEFLKQALSIVKLAIPLVSGLAVIYFFWGIGQFILHDAGNDKTRDEGKKKILWGVIALFVMLSIMGIVSFIGDTLGISTGLQNTSGTAGGLQP